MSMSMTYIQLIQQCT